MRIKARALGMAAEDYFNDKVLEDTDLLYTGTRALPQDFWEKHGHDMESWQQAGHTYYRVRGPLCSSLVVNQFVYQEEEKPFYAQVKEMSGKTAILQTLKDYAHQRNNVWGVIARNREQNFALNIQDAAHARRRTGANPRGQGLLGNHHDAGHGAGR
jgi:PhoH-like ATPase